MDKYRLGDTEGEIRIPGDVDVSTIASAIIAYRKPDWTTGSFIGSYTTGYDVFYQIQTANDLDVLGYWTAWIVYTMPDGDILTSSEITFKVIRPGYGGC